MAPRLAFVSGSSTGGELNDLLARNHRRHQSGAFAEFTDYDAGNVQGDW